MSKNAAGEERMGSLHAAVADTLIEQLKGIPQFDDPDDPTKETGRYVDPRFITAAIAFLNNNKIVMNPFLEEKASEIEEALRARKRRFTVVASEAANEAAANV